MRLQRIVAPAYEPVTTAQARAHLALEGSDFDAQLARLITAAREWAEGFTNRLFIAQRWQITWPAFPDGAIDLPFGRCLSIQSVQYRDTEGAWQTLRGPTSSPQGTAYEEDLSGLTCGIIAPVLNGTWPTAVTTSMLGALRVTATFGYESGASPQGSAVPADIRQAILCRLADMFLGKGPADEQWTTAAESLLAPYHIRSVAVAHR